MERPKVDIRGFYRSSAARTQPFLNWYAWETGSGVNSHIFACPKAMWHSVPVTEVSMDNDPPGRRAFLKAMTALGAAGLPPVAPARRLRPVDRVDASVKANAGVAYDPAARFEITVQEVEFRRTAAGRTLMARIYQPQGTGPYPTILDLHGGAWNAKDRRAEEPMDRALASSGVLVVAIDMTLAPEAPYPACVQDANYGVRWLKMNAPSWRGNPSKVGIYGSSSGGHVAELLAMRPRDARYNAIPLAAAPRLDATVAYVATRSPISNPYARFQNAEKLKRDSMVKNHTTFFKPWDTIHESNPQEILERHESVTLVPLLIMQGALDDNVLPAVQEKFAATYQAAGGECHYQLFEGCEHEWVATPGPQTDRAREMVKAFIARQMNA
jgi:acetyl esterase